MTTVVDHEVFTGHHRFALPDGLHDLELRRCTFRQCQAPAQKALDERPTLRRILLKSCHVEVSDLGPVIAEACTIDTIWFHRGIWGPQRLRGCALRRVTIKGNVRGAVQIDYSQRFGLAAYALDDEFVLANAAFYETVD